MAYFSITELQDIGVVGLEWLRCLTHGDHTSMNTIYQYQFALFVICKAFHIEGDVGHVVVNFRHPFVVVM